MAELNYDDAPFAVRGDLAVVHGDTWDRLASPGTWLDAETRVAIAAEVRAVKDCAVPRPERGAVALWRRRRA